MPLKIVRNDITKMECDAIVNAANSSLLGGGGVDGAIHRAAGKELLKECRTLGGCNTGEAKITGAYNLPAKYVIHTVGPVWNGGNSGEEMLLKSCYKNSLELAKQNDVHSIAFPLISSGVYGYPKDKALKAATDAITEFLMRDDSDMLVYIVLFTKESITAGKKLFLDIKAYIDDNYVGEEYYQAQAQRTLGNMLRRSAPSNKSLERSAVFEQALAKNPHFEEMFNELDESFTQMLLRKIDEKGYKDSECYKKANIDRRLFSKIRGDLNYKPRKETALAFAVALELDLDETNELLRKAGLALSHSNKFDVIVEYFIKNKIYDIFTINNTLFDFDQTLLGNVAQ